jgi:uncharacterized SAM-binding protein YcdF (DUF218 family)
MTYHEPLIFIFFLIGLAGFLFRRRGLVLAGLLGVVLVCWPPVEWLLSRPLEAQYPTRPFRPEPGLQAIVVFSAGVSPAIFERPYPNPDKETIERCEYAAWIYRMHPLPMVVSGGGPRLPAFSETMRELIRRAGVPDEMIWTERRSHNTYQNARFTAEILRARGIQRVVLVVNARSMMRAAACLRKQGIQVVPAPSRFRDLGPWRNELFPDWRGLKGNEETLHEVLGLLWYRLRGWI